MSYSGSVQKVCMLIVIALMINHIIQHHASGCWKWDEWFHCRFICIQRNESLFIFASFQFRKNSQSL